MLMNNACVQTFNVIQASMCKLWPYLCPYHCVLPEVVLQELHCLQNIQYADAHLHMKILTKFRTACWTEQQQWQRQQVL